jgi:hypothetical protein
MQAADGIKTGKARIHDMHIHAIIRIPDTPAN